MLVLQCFVNTANRSGQPRKSNKTQGGPSPASVCLVMVRKRFYFNFVCSRQFINAVFFVRSFKQKNLSFQTESRIGFYLARSLLWGHVQTVHNADNGDDDPGTGARWNFEVLAAVPVLFA